MPISLAFERVSEILGLIKATRECWNDSPHQGKYEAVLATSSIFQYLKCIFRTILGCLFLPESCTFNIPKKIFIVFLDVCSMSILGIREVISKNQ